MSQLESTAQSAHFATIVFTTVLGRAPNLSSRVFRHSIDVREMTSGRTAVTETGTVPLARRTTEWRLPLEGHRNEFCQGLLKAFNGLSNQSSKNNVSANAKCMYPTRSQECSKEWSGTRRTRPRSALNHQRPCWQRSMMESMTGRLVLGQSSTSSLGHHIARNIMLIHFGAEAPVGLSPGRWS
jgi:hypothetical protein